MAEFSAEYLELNEIITTPDFSFKEEFKLLKEGETKPLICEGFGTKAIHKSNGVNYVLLMNDQETTLHLLLSNN